MSHRIERVTERAAIAGGIDPRDVDQIARLALRRHGRARRVMEIAVGRTMKVVEGPVRPNMFSDGYDARNAIDADHFDTDVTLFATVPLGRDATWRGDALFATAPDAVGVAAIGRRLGEIVDHPWLDADATALAPQVSGALVSVAPRVRTLASPSLRTLPRRTVVRWRMLRDEMDMRTTYPRRIRLIMTVMCVNILILAILGSLGFVGHFSSTGLAALWLGVLICGSQAVNAWRSRPMSPLVLALAHSRHVERMEERKRNR